MLASATISYDIADLVGNDFDARRTKVYVTTNIDDDTIRDTTGHKIRLGDGTGTVDETGAGSISLWVPGPGANPASWQYTIHIDYARRTRSVRDLKSFGPYTITGDAWLDDLDEEQGVPPTYLSQVTAELDALVDQAEAARDAAVSIAGIPTGGTDGQVLTKSGSTIIWATFSGGGPVDPDEYGSGAYGAGAYGS